MFNEELILKLRICSSESEINNIFESYDISSLEDKIRFLNESMYNPETFYSLDTISNDNKLKLTIEIFLMKDWKLNETYEKAGF